MIGTSATGGGRGTGGSGGGAMGGGGVGGGGGGLGRLMEGNTIIQFIFNSSPC